MTDRIKARWLRNDTAIGALLALIAFAVYAYTAMPSVPAEDAGEIATALDVLGIVHPTGYPLFTLLGHAWLQLPLDGRPIARLNLLMAVLCAAAVYFLYRLFIVLLREAFAHAPSAKGKSGKGIAAATGEGDGLPGIAAAGGALALAFSRIAWTNAGSLEVYALHLLFLPLVTLLFVKSVFRGTMPENAAPEQTWMLFAYILGLSFSNHMMTVLLAPGFLFLFFATHGTGRRAWRRIARAIPPFALGLTPYLYLPVRAAAKPLANWGDTTTWENFLQHASGAQYRFKMFESFTAATHKAAGFMKELPPDFGNLPLILAAFGLLALAVRARRLLVFSLLVFLAGAVYEANYNFPDPNFRLNAHFSVAMWIAAGIFGAARLVLDRTGGSPMRTATVLCALAGIAPLSANFPEMNRREEYAVEDYARNVLASVDSGAVLLTDEEWTVLFPAMYLQRVEGVRPDVAILHPGACLIGWNQEYIRRTTPWVFEAAPEEAAALFDLSKSLNAKSQAGDLAARRGTWTQVARGLVRKNAQSRPVHATFMLFFNGSEFGNLAQEYAALPVGMTFRIFPDSFPSAAMPVRNPVFRTIREESEMGLSLGELYPDMHYNRGVYEAGFLHDTTAAVRSFLKAQELMPGHAMSKEWLIKLGAWR